MTVFQKIEEQIKQAMRAKEQTMLDSLRYLKAEIQKVAKDAKADVNAVTDEMSVSVIKTTIKKLSKAYDLYVEQDQNLRALDAKVEIGLYEDFLPDMLSDAETEEAVKKAIKEVGATEKKDMGKVMGYLKKTHGETIDMGFASKVVQYVL